MSDDIFERERLIVTRYVGAAGPGDCIRWQFTTALPDGYAVLTRQQVRELALVMLLDVEGLEIVRPTLDKDGGL